MKRNLGQKNDAKLIDPDNVPSTFVAELLAITPVAVSKLATARTIRTNGRRGKYRLTEAIPAYIASIRGSGKADADARLKVQQTRKLQLANDEHAGKLVKIADAAQVYRSCCMYWRCLIAELPKRLAPESPRQTTRRKYASYCGMG